MRVLKVAAEEGRKAATEVHHPRGIYLVVEVAALDQLGPPVRQTTLDNCSKKENGQKNKCH